MLSAAGCNEDKDCGLCKFFRIETDSVRTHCSPEVRRFHCEFYRGHVYITGIILLSVLFDPAPYVLANLVVLAHESWLYPARDACWKNVNVLFVVCSAAVALLIAKASLQHVAAHWQRWQSDGMWVLDFTTAPIVFAICWKTTSCSTPWVRAVIHFAMTIALAGALFAYREVTGWNPLDLDGVNLHLRLFLYNLTVPLYALDVIISDDAAPTCINAELKSFREIDSKAERGRLDKSWHREKHAVREILAGKDRK